MNLTDSPQRGGKIAPGAKDGGRRRASKEVRREQLINATIDSLAKRGFSATTLADVADGAGLSRGIVNFHFDSKEKLLTETLQFMADDYRDHWQKALAAADSSATARLRALVCSDFDKRVCSQRMVAAWFAFWAEARSRPSYQKLCWARDDEFLAAIQGFCEELKGEAGYLYDPAKTATAIYSMLEGLWLRLMLAGKDFKREAALAIALDMLGTIFPRHFDTEGRPR